MTPALWTALQVVCVVFPRGDTSLADELARPPNVGQNWSVLRLQASCSSKRIQRAGAVAWSPPPAKKHGGLQPTYAVAGSAAWWLVGSPVLARGV